MALGCVLTGAIRALAGVSGCPYTWPHRLLRLATPSVTSRTTALLLRSSFTRTRLGFPRRRPECFLKSECWRRQLEKCLALAWDDEEDERTQLEVLLAHMGCDAKSAMLEEPYGGPRDGTSCL